MIIANKTWTCVTASQMKSSTTKENKLTCFFPCAVFLLTVLLNCLWQEERSRSGQRARQANWIEPRLRCDSSSKCQRLNEQRETPLVTELHKPVLNLAKSQLFKKSASTKLLTHSKYNSHISYYTIVSRNTYWDEKCSLKTSCTPSGETLTDSDNVTP